MIKPSIYVKLILKSEVVMKLRSKKSRRIINFIESNNFQNCVFDVDVTYEIGCHNKGIYENKKEARYALKVFTEKGCF